MKKIKNTPGFTLAELLIVVAISSVLVAVSIPVFTSQLEKSRESADLANVRAAYAEVMTTFISQEKDESIYDENKGYYRCVDLKQKVDGWQIKKDLTIGGIDSTDTTHWIGVPSAGGICVVSIKDMDEKATIEWLDNDGVSNEVSSPTYKKALVTETAKEFEESINQVLQTLYDELVTERLEQPTGQISFVLFNNGKVTNVYTYTERSVNGGNKITSEIDLDQLNQKITDSLAATGYSISGTCRIFFDRDGNCVSNANEDGTWNKIAGQGTGASLKFVKDKKGTEVKFYDDAVGWYK